MTSFFSDFVAAAEESDRQREIEKSYRAEVALTLCTVARGGIAVVNPIMAVRAILPDGSIAYAMDWGFNGNTVSDLPEVNADNGWSKAYIHDAASGLFGVEPSVVHGVGDSGSEETEPPALRLGRVGLKMRQRWYHFRVHDSLACPDHCECREPGVPKAMGLTDEMNDLYAWAASLKGRAHLTVRDSDCLRKFGDAVRQIRGDSKPNEKCWRS